MSDTTCFGDMAVKNAGTAPAIGEHTSKWTAHSARAQMKSESPWMPGSRNLPAGNFAHGHRASVRLQEYFAAPRREKRA